MKLPVIIFILALSLGPGRALADEDGTPEGTFALCDDPKGNCNKKSPDGVVDLPRKMVLYNRIEPLADPNSPPPIPGGSEVVK